MKLVARAIILGAIIFASTSTPVKADSLEKSTYDQLVQEILVLTNKERASYGLKPLRLNDHLTYAAQWMAEDMGEKNYFAHTDSYGRGIGERVPTFGYYNYAELRENLAAGQESAQEVVQAWMDSPGHRANLLSANCEEIGIAYYQNSSSKYKRYWVQEFGKQRN